MTAAKIAETALLKTVAPENILASDIIDEQLQSEEDPTHAFYAKLQVAWRDGETTPEERDFAEQMGVGIRTYLAIRKRTKPEPGVSRFQTIAGLVFDTDPREIKVTG
jgi:hypothetical protein